ncbi:hypothetical protein SE15_02165 [Thermanaerothrix daxensis]|uniref:Uncharacterized protein n=1 Tax=Thermanaerothrix daxensis TaxID=869279 RepID=A0A0P6YMN4_9CHLR|nr:hypothetical protein [Thermanaerothrix daxensis]KPL84016.1 hypothetical protein SE15_02165 [Thermanaerothrix daxensis]
MTPDDLDNYPDEASSSQPPLYLLTGLVLGLLLGLFIARVLSPLRYMDTAPAMLSESYKATYRLLIAQAYQSNGNLERARLRLHLLDGDLAPQALASQAQQWLAEGNNLEAARALAELVAALAQPTPPSSSPAPPTPASGSLVSTVSLPTLGLGQAIATPTSTPSPTPTLTPWPTFTPRPSPTQRPALQAPFKLVDQRPLCENGVPAGLLQIYLTDNAGQPLAGVPITLFWSGGQNVFYTGLYPAISPGYADALLDPNLTYDVRPGDVGETVRGLQPPQCKAPDGQTFIGGWRLEFAQP